MQKRVRASKRGSKEWGPRTAQIAVLLAVFVLERPRNCKEEMPQVRVDESINRMLKRKTAPNCHPQGARMFFPPLWRLPSVLKMTEKFWFT